MNSDITPKIKYRWFVHIVTLLVIALFIRLGIWQLDRGNFKLDIQQAAETNSTKIVKQFTLPLVNLESWRHKNIRLTGNYISEHQFLLDNQIRDRQVGYSVLSPFYVPSMQTTVLVDRGWVPQATRREELPEVAVSGEIVEIKGSIYVPYEEAYSLGEIAEGEDQGWPRRIQFVDYKQLSARLDSQIQPFTLRLDAVEDHGYRRDWVQSQSPANTHFGYAFQWFAMAFAVVVLWWINIVMAKRKHERN